MQRRCDDGARGDVDAAVLDERCSDVGLGCCAGTAAAAAWQRWRGGGGAAAAEGSGGAAARQRQRGVRRRGAPSVASAGRVLFQVRDSAGFEAL